MQIIYHGSYCQVKDPSIIQGKYTKDFGEGFYCTILREQAEKWARKYDTSFINIYSFVGITLIIVFCLVLEYLPLVLRIVTS